MQEIVTNFINTFNTKIAAAIDEMNKSDSDFDTIDLDFTQAGKVQAGEEGTEGETVTDVRGNDLSALYASGKSVTTLGKSADYYSNIADQMIERMKSQMLTKAKAMCTANGVKFDVAVFTTMFNNAKETAKNAGVSGVASPISIYFKEDAYSSSTLNTRTLLDTFVEQFKTNYTDWVKKQKTENK